MAERIEFTDVTIPAGTPIAAPVTIPVDFDDGIVERLEMRWPAGPSGLVGLRVGHSGQVIIPFSINTFLISDDEAIAWPLSGYPTANKWFVQGYNLDIYPHTIQFRWLINETATSTPPRVSLVPIT